MSASSSKKHPKKPRIFLRLFVGAVVYVVILALLIAGKNVAVLNPKGAFAQSEYDLIVLTVSVMLAVLIPTLIVLYSFAWHYKDSNRGAKHNNPNAHANPFLFILLWAIPLTVLAILAPAMWRDTHKFTPNQSFNSSQKPLDVQVIAMQWKWLFIYPEQNVASVNYVRIPVDRPVHFELTADNMPMSSFWVPNLGGMLYVMTGHVNKLNLLADHVGQYPGKTAEINGIGYAGMHFVVDATTSQDFDNWITHTQQSSPTLTSAEYAKLLKPSENNPVAYYSPVQSDIYANVLTKYPDQHMSQSNNTSKSMDTSKPNGNNTMQMPMPMGQDNMMKDRGN